MIEKGLVAFLLADPAITGQVGRRVYRRAAQGDPYPRITYQRISTTRLGSLGGTTVAYQVRLQLDLWHKGPNAYGSLQTLAQAIRDSTGNGDGAQLDGFEGYWSYSTGRFYVSACHVLDDRDDERDAVDATEEAIEHRSLDLLVRYEQVELPLDGVLLAGERGYLVDEAGNFLSF